MLLEPGVHAGERARGDWRVDEESGSALPFSDSLFVPLEPACRLHRACASVVSPCSGKAWEVAWLPRSPGGQMAMMSQVTRPAGRQRSWCCANTWVLEWD